MVRADRERGEARLKTNQSGSPKVQKLPGLSKVLSPEQGLQDPLRQTTSNIGLDEKLKGEIRRHASGPWVSCVLNSA